MLINLFTKLQVLLILKLISFKNLGRANSSAQFHYYHQPMMRVPCQMGNVDFLDAVRPPFFGGQILTVVMSFWAHFFLSNYLRLHQIGFLACVS